MSPFSACLNNIQLVILFARFELFVRIQKYKEHIYSFYVI